MKKLLTNRAFVLALAVLAGILIDRWLLGTADFDQIYRIVFGRVVYTSKDELTAVTLAETEQDPSLETSTGDDQTRLPLPTRLQSRLEVQWTFRGLGMKQIVSVNRVRPVYGEIERGGFKLKAFERYVDSETGQAVRLFRIDSVRWLGSNEVLVNWSATHASLDSKGSSIRLKKFFGFWRVVGESRKWIS